MATYEINVPALQTAIGNLQGTLELLQKEIKDLENTKTTLLNDNCWKGPNKANYTKKFENYQTSLTALYNSAVEHLNKLNEITATYLKAEM